MSASKVGGNTVFKTCNRASLMSFPATRHSLIQRLAVTGAEEDWRQFLEDYWQPVCRFAANWGRLRFEDAEDVGSATFQVVLAGNLLQRWL